MDMASKTVGHQNMSPAARLTALHLQLATTIVETV